MNVYYQKNIENGDHFLTEEESKHCAQVLRQKVGDQISVFDGSGNIYESILTEVHKKKCVFEITNKLSKKKSNSYTHLAISPTKNIDRIEWLIEKLVEMGVDEVSLIETTNSERRKIRMDRLEKKAVSAMKQSKNPFLPRINDLTKLSSILNSALQETKLIAHIDYSNKYLTELITSGNSVLMLIGPEGDFSPEEVAMAKSNGFQSVSLGQNTLRTETAGLVACCIINSVNRL